MKPEFIFQLQFQDVFMVRCIFIDTFTVLHLSSSIDEGVRVIQRTAVGRTSSGRNGGSDDAYRNILILLSIEQIKLIG